MFTVAVAATCRSLSSENDINQTQYPKNKKLFLKFQKMRGNLTVFRRHHPAGSSIRTPSRSSPHWGECNWRREGGGATDRALGLREVTERRRGRRKGRRGRAATTVRGGRYLGGKWETGWGRGPAATMDTCHYHSQSDQFRCSRVVMASSSREGRVEAAGAHMVRWQTWSLVWAGLERVRSQAMFFVAVHQLPTLWLVEYLGPTIELPTGTKRCV